MPVTINTVASEAMQLPEGQRLTLAYRLLSSVEPIPNPEIEALWDAEICERIRRYDAERSTAIPATQVFKELDQQFSR